MRDFIKNFLSTLMAVALALGLCPSFAFADSLTAATPAASTPTTTVTQDLETVTPTPVASTTLATQADDVIEVTAPNFDQIAWERSSMSNVDMAWSYTDESAIYGMAVTLSADTTLGYGSGCSLTFSDGDGNQVLKATQSNGNLANLTVYIPNSIAFKVRLSIGYYSSHNVTLKVANVRPLAADEQVPRNLVPGSTSERELVEQALFLDGIPFAEWPTLYPRTGSAMSTVATFDQSIIALSAEDYTISFKRAFQTGTPDTPLELGRYNVVVSGAGIHKGWSITRTFTIYGTAEEFESYAAQITIPATMTTEIANAIRQQIAEALKVYEDTPDATRQDIPESSVKRLEGLRSQINAMRDISSSTSSDHYYVSFSDPNGDGSDAGSFEFAYDGQPHELDVTVTHRQPDGYYAFQYIDTPLVKGQDFEVIYYKGTSSTPDENIMPVTPTFGKYSILVRGIGPNYYGEQKFTSVVNVVSDLPCAILYVNGDFVIQPTSEPDGKAGHTPEDIVKVYEAMTETVQVDSGYGYTNSQLKWYTEKDQIKNVTVAGLVTTSSLASWFADCSNLETASLAGLDIAPFSPVSYLFQNNSRLTTVDLSGVRLGNIAGSYYSSYYDTFRNCSSFTTLVTDEGTTLLAGMLPLGTWTSADGQTSYATTADFVAAFNHAPVSETWTFDIEKNLSRAQVSWRYPYMVAYVEGGLPDLSRAVSSVSFNGLVLRYGIDYTVRLEDESGVALQTAPIADSGYYARVIGIGEFADTEYGYRQLLSVVDEYDIGQVTYPPNYTSAYRGAPQSVSWSESNRLTGDYLYRDADFVVSYETSDGEPAEPIEPGQYQIILTGIGLYHGTQRGILTIDERNDLRHASVTINSVILSLGRVVNAVLVAVSGTPLVEDVHYTLKYYDEEGNELDSIKDPGVYQYAITPIEGGGYFNEPYGNRNSNYTITLLEGEQQIVPPDLYDLSNAMVYVAGIRAYEDGYGGAVAYDYGNGVIPEVSVQIAGKELTEGVDYELVDWRTSYWNGSVASLPLAASSERYYFTVRAVEGGDYCGSIRANLKVVSAADLSYAQASIANSDFSINETPLVDYADGPTEVKLNLTVDGELVDSSSYELMFAKCEGDAREKGKVVGKFTTDWPSDPGLYAVNARAIGAGYTGVFHGNRTGASSSTSSLYVQVGKRNDLAFASTYAGVYNYTGATVRVWVDAHFPTGESYNTRSLVEGTDYELVGYRNEVGELVDRVIDEGIYTAELRGIGAMTGEAKATFSVREYGNFSSADIDYNYNVAYTGKEAHPDFTVTLNGEPLQLGVDYEIESVWPDSAYERYSEGPVAMGYYRGVLRGVSARGIVGAREFNYRIIDGRNLSNSNIEGIDYEYSYTGSLVNPKPSAVKANGRVLREGDDYVIEYRKTYYNEVGTYVSQLVTDCVEEGDYEVRLVGYGDYACYGTRSFHIMKAEKIFYNAKLYLVKDGIRTQLYGNYDYTGVDLLEGSQLEIEVGGLVLDSSRYRLEGPDSVVNPGSYSWQIYPIDPDGDLMSGYAWVYIKRPPAAAGTVQATGSILTANSSGATDTQVKLSVVDKSTDEGATATARSVVAACSEIEADYVGVVDVNLDVVKSSTGEVVDELTENFGDLTLSFGVGEQYDGTAARIVQIHADSETGVIEALRHPITRVVDGRVSVTVDRLSEFIVMVGAQAENLEFERPKEVVKPVASDFVYNGSEHACVPQSEGYVLSGTSRATEVGDYVAQAVPAEGYEWTDGGTASVELKWKIYRQEETGGQDSGSGSGSGSGEDPGTNLGTDPGANPVDDSNDPSDDPDDPSTGPNGPSDGPDPEPEPEPEPTPDPNLTPEPPAVERVVMFRLYNPNSGEHFYTAAESERDGLVKAGWNDEGEAWVAPTKSDTPVYRLYNSHEPLGDHHYTTDRDEYLGLIELGWTGEDIGWYSDDAKGVGLFRLYNPNAYVLGRSGAHHYTADKDERDGLIGLGWQDEEYGWFGLI